MQVKNGTNGHLKDAASGSTEVIAKPSRRRFTTAYIEAVLKELDSAPHEKKGKILRFESLFSKQVTSLEFP